MKKLFLLLFSVTLLFAQNPIIYSALGDVIYDNAPKIYKLLETESFLVYNTKIRNYYKEVQKTKKIGFALENGTAKIDKKAYLNKLRALSNTNDFFVREVDKSFHEAIENEDNALFDAMINSSLLDTKKYKQEILDYYFKHEDQLMVHGVIQQFLDENKKLMKKHKKRTQRKKSKKERELERIRYIRQKDKLEQERLERELELRLKKKKEQIRAFQQKELSKTI